jgi:hypothetical protein
MASAVSGATINRAGRRPCSVANRSTMVSNSATISAVLAIGSCSRSATWTAILLPWLGGDRRPRPHGPSARVRRRRWPSQSFEVGCPMGSTTVALLRGWPSNGRLPELFEGRRYFLSNHASATATSYRMPLAYMPAENV